MNYLAHTFLSGDNEQIIIGNFIGDFVKGNQYKNFSTDIQKGIKMHREIDSFTDHSLIVKESTAIFSSTYGRYSSIIVDILYDHFLSVHWKEYSNYSRDYFIQNIYRILLKYYPILPARAKKLIPSVVYHNWVRYYASFYGLEKVLSRMSIRTSLPSETQGCIQVMRENYSELDNQFVRFWETLIRNKDIMGMRE